MILRTEIFPVGRFTKTHGMKGELAFEYYSDAFENDDIKYVVLDADGIFVPFFLETLRFFTAESGVAKLEDVDTETKQKCLIGREIFLPNEFKGEDDDISVSSLVGYDLFDGEHRVGLVASIDDTTENELFVVETENGDVYIPIVDDFFVEINEMERQIKLALPEGLLGLNL